MHSPVLSSPGGALPPRTGAGVAAIYFTFAGTQDIVNALRGETNPNDLPEKLGDNAVKALTAGVGTWVIISACSNPGTMTIALVSLGVVVTVEYAYSKVKPLFERQYRAEEAYYVQLPASLKQACPLEWTQEAKPLEKFGKVYGPRLGSTIEPGSKGTAPLQLATAPKGPIPLLW